MANEYAGMIQQGFGILGQGIANEAAKNRRIHPVLDKYLRAVMDRTMSPSEAAIRAKMEMGQGGPQQPQAQPQAEVPYFLANQGLGGFTQQQAQPFAPQDTAVPFTQAPAQPTRINQLAAPPSRPQPGLGDLIDDRPFSAQDLQDASTMFPIFPSTKTRNGLTFEEMIQLEREKEGGRQTRQGRSLDFKRESLAADQQLAADKIDASWKELMARLAETRQNIHIKGGQSIDAAKLSTLAGMINNLENNLRQYQMGNWGTHSPEVDDKITAYNEMLPKLREEYERLKNGAKAPSREMSITSERTPNPSPAAPNTSAIRERAKNLLLKK